MLANVSDIAYINVELTETATGRHPSIAIVGQDGNPYTSVHYPPTDSGTRLLIRPASRFAIAVTIPAEGDLILEMPERGGGAKTITAPGVLYTNNGSDNSPAVLGSLSVLPSAVSYADGIFKHRASAVRDVQTLRRGSVRRKRRHGLCGLFDRPRDYRHCARPWHPDEG